MLRRLSLLMGLSVTLSSPGSAQPTGPVTPSPGLKYYYAIPPVAEPQTLRVDVCVAVSSSHIAFGSIRMEPVFLLLGQSAGTAACLAIAANVPVQRVPYPTLRARLLAAGQILDWPAASARQP